MNDSTFLPATLNVENYILNFNLPESNTLSRHPLKGTMAPLRPIASCLAAVPAIYLAAHLHGRLSPTPRDSITTRPEVAASLRDSATIRQIVNPRGHVQSGDSHSIDLDVPAGAARITDEALLAAFTRGFFAGSIFGPERFVLRLLRPMFKAPGSLLSEIK